MFTWVAEKVATISNRNMTPEESQDAIWLIGLGPATVPVEMLLRKGLDFNTLIDKGVHMDHFLSNGYTIADLEKFPEMTPEMSSSGVLPLGVEALKALDFRATHLRTHHTQLPYARVCEATGLNDLHLVNEFGLNFHPRYGIVSPGLQTNAFDRDWSIGTLMYLGFTSMDDFLDKLHMTSLSQWYAMRPTEEQKEALGVQQHHLDRLYNDVAMRDPTTPPSHHQRHVPPVMNGMTRPPATVPAAMTPGGVYTVPGTGERALVPSHATQTGMRNTSYSEGGVLYLFGDDVNEEEHEGYG